MGNYIQSPKKELLKNLQGQKLEIPDLHDLFRDWPQRIHPEVERLRSAITESHERFVPSSLSYRVYY